MTLNPAEAARAILEVEVPRPPRQTVRPATVSSAPTTTRLEVGEEAGLRRAKAGAVAMRAAIAVSAAIDSSAMEDGIGGTVAVAVEVALEAAVKEEAAAMAAGAGVEVRLVRPHWNSQ